ncbi:MAG: ABC transporter ATP-binding protein [Nocardioidaceae bacterium]
MALTVRDLTVRFGDTVAVDDVSLDVATGQVLAVLGPSGCGKSSLLRAVAGLELTGSGSIAYDGVDLTRTPAHKRGFALMFQDGQLLEHRTVAANVGYALRVRHVPRSEADAEVRRLLGLVGLGGYDDRLPATLSGGERQRVALARSLAAKPRLLLLDEPLSALDRALRERLATDLREILVAAGTTALLVTHDHEEAFAVADQMALMRAGRIVQRGTLDEVWAHPVDAEAALFLGYRTVLEDDRAARLRAVAGLAGAGSLALRRSALVVDPEGPVAGVVREARLDPEQTRLVVEIDHLGRLDAVAPLQAQVSVGEHVRLRLDPTRTAAFTRRTWTGWLDS